MQTYVCKTCGYLYDPAEGDETAGILPGQPFPDLPHDWKCPCCSNGKDHFVALGAEPGGRAL